MTIEKRVVLDHVEIKRDGTVFLKLQKQIVEGDRVLSQEPHRSPIEPGITAADQIGAVNAHLVQMGWPKVSSDDAARLAAHVKIAHTPEAVAAFKKRVADDNKRVEAELAGRVK